MANGNVEVKGLKDVPKETKHLTNQVTLHTAVESAVSTYVKIVIASTKAFDGNDNLPN